MIRHLGLGFTGICGLVLSLGGGPARADPAAFVGSWHWNRAQSTLPPSESARPDTTVDILRVDGAHVKWSIRATTDLGQTWVQSFDIPANGEFYSVSGNTAAAFRLVGPTIEATFRESTGRSDALTCAVSPDRAKMTCSGALRGEDGKTETYVDVYDRNG